ncbi:Uncharacterised protein [Candidatus Ornithobacterium hominis]|uniref:DNA mismatch repair protein MutS-like N-terminal domain-containing protein n=1 Tax=Candidatus Ornithobacterium hominis TaxID=2497989 RepID=A0A383TW58_9FLAO|nr:hypothetical protein [Candidatus Ornithobacterium hominis]MCT7904799.1 hypothetical protein [Candidatus Ornithobacterium hominis]MCT7905213.1 hypothetical protein [Candidatus Ornithobacterium hominis]CAI9429193.1 MutS-I domain-containing protein [Candidatus Ornithobacterium hominis]SZD71567.1 Uncharacterised protein [Candidatus Ornithobacterium hominis]SZD72181.1 Uncharacterised protein [Candidatus Ornithobacterium hominis]
MNTQEKLNLIDQDKYNSLILFKEGNFRKCYNEHAMFFVENVKMMKIHTRFYKNVQKYIHAIGFPERSVGKYVDWVKEEFKAKIEEDTAEYIRLVACRWKKKYHYKVWEEPLIQIKEGLMLEEKRPSIDGSYKDKICTLLDEFAIEKSTPLEAFQFLIKLKHGIKEPNN